MKNPLEPVIGPQLARFIAWLEAGSLWRPVLVGGCSWFLGAGGLMLLFGLSHSRAWVAGWFMSTVLWGLFCGLILILKRRRSTTSTRN